MRHDELKQLYRTYKKNLQDEKTEEQRTKLVKRKEYIKAYNEKILEGVSVEPVQAIREAQKLTDESVALSKAVVQFKRPENLYSPVNPTLAKNMRHAYRGHLKKQKEKS